MKKREALDILGLEEGATDEQVKAAHRAKVREHHPDRVADPAKKKEAEELTKSINEARDVLVNRSWDPEYGPRPATGGTYTNPYAGSARPAGGHTYTYTYNPFTGTAYTSPGSGTGSASGAGAGSGTGPGTGGTGAAGGNPYGGSPFEGIPFTYVWTSWDDAGAAGGAGSHGAGGSNRTGGAGGAGGNPYGGNAGSNPFDPFAAMFAREPRKTDEQRLGESRAELRTFAGFVGVKLAVLAVCAALGGLGSGMFAYTVATLLYLLSREVQGCSSLLVVPFVLFFAPTIMWFIPSFGQGVGSGLLICFVLACAYDFGTARRLLEQYRTLKAKASIPKK